MFKTLLGLFVCCAIAWVITWQWPGWGKVSDFAQIITAIMAAATYIYFAWQKAFKKARLVGYLKKQKVADARAGKGKHGRRTILHLMSKLSMTESEILQSAFASNEIESTVKADEETGHATAILFSSKDVGGTQ
jgi:uncharacterized protein CbrC (UPF0167 family)